jgi:carotenoid cleavage dioxygenase
MKVELVESFASGLPEDDDHPYRTGAWKPNVREYDAVDLTVTGRLPDDLSGVYLRNTENPLHDAIGRYHPFDGDGMLHALFVDNGEAEYRNRFIRTDGFAAELAEGRPLWAGLMESPKKSLREGCGARTRLKDASSTDVVVHGGRAVTSFYQCGDLYEFDPRSLTQLGKADWVAGTTPGWGISAHTKVDEATGEMLFFNYAKEAPFMHYGVVNAARELVHYVPVPLPGPRLPHDMAFTDNYAILNDFPLYWDPEALRAGAHAVRFFADQPSRFGIIPRRGGSDEVRWFEAKPTFVLHWINAYEDGDEVVLDGFFEENPNPKLTIDPNDKRSMFRMLDMHVIGAKPYRWRFNLRTGATREEYLDDAVSEFGMINPAHGGKPYRYVWAVTLKPGWFLMDGLIRLDVQTGEKQLYQLPDGVFLSESPMAPRVGSTAEDDGYVVTFVTDMNTDSSSAMIFDAADIEQGPVAQVQLPERICVGTNSCWSDKRNFAR